MVRNSIRASEHGNCLELEEKTTSSMFNLKWKKHSTTLSEPEEFNEEDFVGWVGDLDSYNLSEFQTSILGYIAGFVVKKLSSKISCEVCVNALTSHQDIVGSLPAWYKLIASKQRGGLKVPSEAVLKILTLCEKSFRLQVCGKEGKNILKSKHIALRLNSLVSRLLNEPAFDLGNHDVQSACLTEDLHSTQLQKRVCEAYIQLRIVTYGKRYLTEVIQAEKSGKRQHLNKTIIFQNL